jgi:hypothetical protein
MRTAVQYQLLEESLAAGHLLKGCNRVERIRALCKTSCGAIPHELMKYLVKFIEINAHEVVS